MPLLSSTGEELTRGRRAFAFFLVTTLFFTWGFSYGLLDVLNAHFQKVFGITKLQSTLLQLAYFGAYFVWAPWAGLFMQRFGYKRGIHLGLTLYSIGAIFFWPSAKYKKYGGFVGSTFVIGCGLATLEVAANSYITVLGSPEYAAVRLNFAQGFQGVATFTGPLIAARWFFTGKNATSLDTVQWVYLAVAGLGIVLNIFFYFCDLPEITEDALAEELHKEGITADQKPFWKQYRCVFGWVAQTAYCGAQVGVASFAVNYIVDQNVGIDQSRASNLFSYCQMTFTAARFISVVILNFVDPAVLLAIYATACAAFCIGVSQAPGHAGIGCLFMVFCFESICYPCIFTLGTKNLGRHTKKGSSLIVMGVGGGAWYPPAQGGLADRANTRRSYLVPASGFLTVMLYAVGLVIDDARDRRLRIRNVDGFPAAAIAALPAPPITAKDGSMSGGKSHAHRLDSDDEKQSEDLHIETV